MQNIISILLALFIFFISLQKAMNVLNINIFDIKNKDFSSFIVNIVKNILKVFLTLFGHFLQAILIFFEKFFDLPSNVSKRHEGFMPWRERIFLLNPFHKGLLLNGKRARLSLANSFTHSIVVANTGRGKTSSFVIPNIFELDN